MRRAFILGANGPKISNTLKYARKDAEKISLHLSKPHCGFTTHLITPTNKASEIRAELYSLAEDCAADDTFLCYFSGHGVLEKGELMLLLDNSDPDKLLGTSLPVADIIRALNFCPAKNKLVILDCCHAGAVVSMIGLKDGSLKRMEDIGIPNESFLILMASGRLEKARELDSLKGSFLTETLCSALEENFTLADHDNDGAISIDDLKRYIDQSTNWHNATDEDHRVPYAELFGRQKGDFQLTLGSLKDWRPFEFEWPNSIKMVCLPTKPFVSSENIEYATCISKYPITNSQYAIFTERTGYHQPAGKIFRTADSKSMGKMRVNAPGAWEAGFHPWQDVNFSNPNQPVVCISYIEACKFCYWLNESYSAEERLFGRARLPSKELWDFAAFGSRYPSRDPHNWLTQTVEIISSKPYPAEIEYSGSRTNARGVSDLFGNIWEWCEKTRGYDNSQSVKYLNRISLTATLGFDGERIDILNLRGGSYLDDLTVMEPFLQGSQVPSGLETVHSDLGFRIACRVRLSTLPENIQFMLRNLRYPEIRFPTY